MNYSSQICVWRSSEIILFWWTLFCSTWIVIWSPILDIDCHMLLNYWYKLFGRSIAFKNICEQNCWLVPFPRECLGFVLFFFLFESNSLNQEGSLGPSQQSEIALFMTWVLISGKWHLHFTFTVEVFWTCALQMEWLKAKTPAHFNSSIYSLYVFEWKAQSANIHIHIFTCLKI